MANPIAFKPKSVNPKLELQARLAAAPAQHAEALLVAYDVLSEAHRQGILDALQGAMAARDTIAGTLADYAAQPEGVNMMRNLLALGKLLGTLDPEPLSRFSDQAYNALEAHKAEEKPPTLWQLFKRAGHADTRRGLSLLLAIVGSIGRAGHRAQGSSS